MHKIIKSICLIFFVILSILSCKKETEKDVQRLYSYPIKLNTYQMQCIYPTIQRDSILYHINDEKNHYKLIVFMDSTECISCATQKMHDWDDFLSEIAVNSISCFFIFNPSKEEQERLTALLIMSKLNFPIYIDSTGIFTKTNPHIPKTVVMHTFLLDKKGNVILIGDPRRSKKLHEIFNRRIKSISIK